MYLVTADEMRRMDRETIDTFGIPGRVLMENAGRGATAFFLETVYRHHPGDVGIAAGRGNNGGDGFVIARHLTNMGYDVEIFLLGTRGKTKGDARTNRLIAEKMGISLTDVRKEKDLVERFVAELLEKEELEYDEIEEIFSGRESFFGRVGWLRHIANLKRDQLSSG